MSAARLPLLYLARRRALCALLSLFAAVMVAAPTQAAEVYPEDAVKAAFLYRFTGYVDWPAPAQNAPLFTIAVLGADTVAAELGKILPTRTIHARPALVRKIRSIGELAGAQMLYVGAGYQQDLSTVLAALRSQPVLVVTDVEGGLDQGGMVNFLRVDRRVRFEISLTAANAAGLRIDSSLLSLAVRVRGPIRSELFCAPPPAAGVGLHLRCPPVVSGL